MKSTYTLANNFAKLTLTSGYTIKGDEITVNTVSPYFGQNIFVAIFIVISSVLLIRFLINIFNLVIKTYKCKNVENGNTTLILVKEQTVPYSFFRCIFLNESDFENGRIGNPLLLHEEAHCLQYHSVDIILIELIKVFFWFNPAIWLFRKEILLNHEYYADNKVLANHEELSYNKLLVNLVVQNNTNYLASNFNYSLIKNRIIMMTKSRPSNNATLRKLAAIPLFLILTITVTFSQENKQNLNIIDFSGKWVLNKSKSNSILTKLASSSITIAQAGISLDMNITITPDNGSPINRTERYALNVSVQNTTSKPEEKSIRIDCIPASDGKSFSITETLSYVENGIKKESKRVSTYSLGKGGKTLIIKQDDTLPEGSFTPESERHEIRVYDKAI